MIKMNQLIFPSIKIWQFTALMASIFFAHVLTLSVSPLPWQDEVQIIEIGRNGVLNSRPGWSMIVPDSGYCSWIPFYLGGLIQELAFRITQSQIGPRILSLLGFMIASFLLSKILIRKGVKPTYAYLVALIFVVDPLLTQNVRGARVDIWTIVCTFLSVYILTRYGDEIKNRGKAAVILFLLGSISMLQLFIWASSILLLPLIAVELLHVFQNSKFGIKTILRCLAWGGLGALSTMIVILLPLMTHWQEVVVFITSVSGKHLSDGIAKNVYAFTRCLIRNPFTGALFLLSVIAVKKSRKYLLAFLLCVIFVLLTRCYNHRFIYLYPYIILSVGLAFVDEKRGRGSGFKKVLKFLVFSSFVFGIGYSVLARNILATAIRSACNSKALENTLSREIGGAGVVIYADTFQTYYAGRRLGWAQNRMEGNIWNTNENAQDVLTACESFLTENTLTFEKEEILREMGFIFKKHIIIPHNTDERLVAFLRQHGRPVGYGPYFLYYKTER